MNSDNILLLGLNQSVTAISKHDGQTLWKTELPVTISGDDFVTVISDGLLVFAHTEGKLHCLDLANGQVLWSNDLKGYGYGIASLCFPGGPSAPDIAAIQTQSSQTPTAIQHDFNCSLRGPGTRKHPAPALVWLVGLSALPVNGEEVLFHKPLQLCLVSFRPRAYSSM